MPSYPRSLAARVWRGLAVVIAALLIVAGGAVAPAVAVVPHSISGTVYLGSIATPAGAGEVLVHWNTNPNAIPATGVLTDAAGAFTIPGLTSSLPYYLWYEYKGAGTYPSVYHPSAVHWSTSTTINVTASDVTGLVGIIPAPGTLSGTVTQLATGATYGDVEVTAFRDNGTSYVQAGVTTHAAPNGDYAIAGLIAGRYKIRVTNVGSAPVQSGYWGGGSFLYPALSFEFGGAGDTSPRNVALTPLQTITGTVTLGANGPASAGVVRVSAWYWDEDNGGNVSLPDVYTNSSGVYSFEGIGTAAHYTLGFNFVGTGLIGYNPQSVTNLSMGTAAVTTRNVTMTKASTIAGTVRLGTGGPMAGAGEVTLTLTHTSFAPITLTTMAGGAFVANTLGAGVYTVKFHYNGTGSYPDITLPYTVTVPGDVTGIAVTMLEGSTLRGQVTWAEYPGWGIEDVTVVAHWVDPDTRAEFAQYTAVTDEDGVYLMEPVHAGWYWTEFISDGLAYQASGGVNEYGEAELFEVGGGLNDHLDAAMDAAADITGWVEGLPVEDVSVGAVTVELQHSDGSGWHDTGRIVTLTIGSSYSYYRLAPGSYRLHIKYDGATGVSDYLSPTLTVTPGQSLRYAPTMPLPVSELVPGTLVKSDTSSTVYLVNGTHHLIPLASMSAATDAGISTTVQTVPQSRINLFVIAAQPLGSIIRCQNSIDTVVASGGHLTPLNFYLARWWTTPVTLLEPSTCQAFTYDTSFAPIDGALYLGAAGGQVYRIDNDGLARPLLGVTNTGALLNSRYRVYTVNATSVGLLPKAGAIALPGALIRSSASSTVYLSDGDHLVPVTNLGTVADFGLSTAVTVVAPSFLDSYVIGSDPLVNVADCEGAFYFGGDGVRQYLSGNLAAGLSRSSLYTDTCDAMPFFHGASGYSISINFALFLKSPSSPTLYFINSSGAKQPVTSMAQVTQLSLPDSPRYLTVNDAYLASLPTGPVLVAPRSLIKVGATTYLVADETNLIPLRSLESVVDFGLSTASTTVTAGMIAGMTIAPQPLSNAVLCGSTTYLASGGVLRPITTGVAGSGAVAVTALPASLCGSLTLGAAVAPLFVKSPASPTVYLVESGVKRAILTWATVTRLAQPAAPVVLVVNAPYLATLTTGSDVIDPGMLVKSASSPTVYLVNDATHFVPVRTFDSITELGLSTAVATVSPGTISAATLDPAPLSNFVTCGVDYYYAAGGVLNRTDSTTVGAAPVTSLTTALCALLPKNNTSLGKPLFLKSPAAATVYVMSAGQKRAIGSWASLVRLAGVNPIVITTVNAPFLTSVPSGPDVVEVGSLVKSASSPTVYLVASETSLVPLRSFDSIAEMGLPTAYTTVSATTISGMTVDPAPLSNLVSCGGETWIATAGKLSKVTGTTIGSLPVATLSTALCALLPKNAGTLTAPLFVKSPTAATLYALDAGLKSPIGLWPSVVRLAGANPIVITTVNAAYLATVPLGPDVVETGGLVKSASSPTLYMVDGSGGLIPLASFQSVTDLGLSTAYATVSAATISSLTVSGTPLGSLVSCGGEKWIAGQGKLWKTTTASTGALPVQTLPASLCAVIPKSTTDLSTPSLVKSTSSPTIYALDNGVKRAVGSWATVLTITGGTGTYVATNPTFIAGIPTGTPIP